MRAAALQPVEELLAKSQTRQFARAPKPPWVLTLAAVAFCAVPVCSHAAIGIFNWYPTPSARYVTVNYRLNTDGYYGQIRIRRASDSALVRTLLLSPADLTRGPHSVVWLGDRDTGGSAVSGSYFAEIFVGAQAVTEQTGQPFANRHDYGVFPQALARYSGVAVDTNPANNNQTNPSLSTYGLIYAANTTEGRIEAYYPDAWAASLASGTSVQPKLVFDSKTTGNQLSPWGLSVAPDGRVFSTARSSGPGQGFWNYSPDGQSWQSGLQNTSAQDTLAVGDPGIGDAFQFRSSGNRIERVQIATDHSYIDSQPGDWSKIADTVLSGGATTIYGLATPGTGALPSPLWTAQPGSNPSLRRYVSAGSAYAYDPTWSLAANPAAPGASALSVAVSPTDPALLAIGCERTVNNLLLVRADSQTVERAFAPASSIVRSVAFDPVGNIVMTSDGPSRSGPQARLSVFFPEDSGSSDTRTTIPFSHTFGSVAPQALNPALTKSSLKENDQDSVDLSVEVYDGDGIVDHAGARADLSPLGYSSSTMMTADMIVSPTTRRYKLTGIRAKSSTRAGMVAIVITPLDKAGAGAPATVMLQIVGGTITGTVRHQDAGFAVGGASVVLLDSQTGNSYTTLSSDEAPTLGQFQVDVNPGVYDVYAEKPYYALGQYLTSITVKQDQVRPSVNPTLAATSLAVAAPAPDGAEICLEGVVAAQPAGIGPAGGAIPGFSNDDGRSTTKWYIRDLTRSGRVEGLAVLDDNFLQGSMRPYRGHRVVVQGIKQVQPGYEPALIKVLHFLDKGPASGSVRAEPLPLGSLVRVSGYDVGGDWGRLVRIEQARVVPGSQRDAGGAYLSFRVTDPSTSTPWLVRVWKSVGATLASLPADYSVLPLEAIVSRLGYFGENVLEPDALRTLSVPAAVAASVGQARQLHDGLEVDIAGGQVVTYLPPPPETGYFFIESPDLSSGIRVEIIDDGGGAPPAPRLGEAVSIRGTLATLPSGERVLRSAAFAVSGPGSVPPLKMTNRAVGGKGYTNGEGGPSTDLSNQGMLIRTWGKVTKVDAQGKYCLLDDGSHVDAADTAPGVKVRWSGALPGLGEQIAVTGVVSAETIAGKMIRVVLAQDLPEGIVYLTH